MKWNARTRGHYESKGYIFTKTGNEFMVSTEDLTDGSGVFIDVQCDGCGIVTKRTAVDCKRRAREDGKHYCIKCAHNGHEKWINLEEWCRNNLSDNDATRLLSRWDYDKNKLSPKEVSFGSAGINKKGYWFKCLNHLDHESVQRNINSLTSGKQTTIDCHQCSSIAIVRPDLVKFLVNKDDSYKYFIGNSKTKIPMKCPECGYKKEMSPNQLTRHNSFSCPRCSDGVSYPEKFMFNLLEQLGVSLKLQLSKTTFSWCNKAKYDFYIEDFNCIIETHGPQHYVDTSGDWKDISLAKTQANDRYKEQLARVNGIEHYVILDCRGSEMQWIKNSIMQSNLPQLLKFREASIDWVACDEHARSSIVREVCALWNEGTKRVLHIADKLKISRSSVRRYLMQGVQLGWCGYDSKIERKNNYKRRSKQVICLTTNQVFNSQLEAGRKYNVDVSTIGRCCSIRQRYKWNKSAGKHPITGEKLEWEYYNETCLV